MKNLTLNKLTAFEKSVIEHKGTEPPFTGEYNGTVDEGIYVCKRCETPLYHSQSKFPSHCGWPSFDQEIPGAVKRIPDADGRRTEIVCEACGGHLGHVFEGEGFTPKNIRHCVNSVSLLFKPKNQPIQSVNVKTAIFASGCFWGAEYYFAKAPGVLKTTVGYVGGTVPNPSYEQVCGKQTGHLEAVEVEYDAHLTNYEKLVQLFFETHDFSQSNGQGPDIGPQYLSALFPFNGEETAIAQKLMDQLKSKNYVVATELRPKSPFYKAEEYHQQYYTKNGQTPYCHRYVKIFVTTQEP